LKSLSWVRRTYTDVLRDLDVAEIATDAKQGLGFLTVVQENNGYLGGYLVTNLWGRPLEFRLSSAVQPNRIQQILYAGTLRSYICADLIGKALVEKVSTAAQCIFTDCEAVLDLRLSVQVPVICLHVEGSGSQIAECPPAANGAVVNGHKRWPVHCHPRFPADAGAVRELLDQLDGAVDLAEPFARIREAMSEARKLGALTRT
jgi:hypothetical protein